MTFVTWMSSSRRRFGPNVAIHGAGAGLGPLFFALLALISCLNIILELSPTELR